MMAPLSSAFATCFEPGPWHASHPCRSRSVLGLRRKIFACRVCEKCRLSSTWQAMHLPSPTYAASCANEAPDCNPAIVSTAATAAARTFATSVRLLDTPLRCSTVAFIAWPLDRCGVLSRQTAESGPYSLSIVELRRAWSLGRLAWPVNPQGLDGAGRGARRADGQNWGAAA